jgi:acyl carrier protein
MRSKEEIFITLQSLVAEMFELSESDVHLSSRLREDLELDSIDAVDLMVKLRNLTGQRVNPEDFKNSLTIEDVVNTIYQLALD